jgi:hypothetical protein
MNQSDISPQESPKPPTWWDAMLYPTSLSGIVMISVVVLVPRMIRFCGKIFSGIYFSQGGSYGGILVGLALAVIYGYIVFYLYECIRDSAGGGARAPDTMMLSIPNKQEMMEQALYIFGCVAICFLPVSLYRLIVGQKDVIFWIFIVYGIFFFPMSFLAVVLFESPSALNPKLIIGSIVDTFLPYCRIVVIFSALAGIYIVGGVLLQAAGIPTFICDAVFMYGAILCAHILGCFFHKYKDRLNWEV